MSLRFDDQTYYEILEISPDAPEHEIHAAYQKAKKTYSPDSPALYTMFTPDEASELSRLIEEAYTVLSNHAARREYDSRLLGRNLNSEKVVKRDERPTIQSSTSTPKGESPPSNGYAKIKLGTYEVDENLESEIMSNTEVDGTFLRKIRVYKNVSLESLSDEIRVSRSYLHAIEENDYESLPADVFVRGFIVQYSKALGLNAEAMAKSYMKKLKDAKV